MVATTSGKKRKIPASFKIISEHFTLKLLPGLQATNFITAEQVKALTQKYKKSKSRD